MHRLWMKTGFDEIIFIHWWIYWICMTHAALFISLGQKSHRWQNITSLHLHTILEWMSKDEIKSVVATPPDRKQLNVCDRRFPPLCLFCKCILEFCLFSCHFSPFLLLSFYSNFSFLSVRLFCTLCVVVLLSYFFLVVWLTCHFVQRPQGPLGLCTFGAVNHEWPND